MKMWKAPPTRGSISASGAKKLVMPSLVVQAAQACSRLALMTTSLSRARSAADALEVANASSKAARTLVMALPPTQDMVNGALSYAPYVSRLPRCCPGAPGQRDAAVRRIRQRYRQTPRCRHLARPGEAFRGALADPAQLLEPDQGPFPPDRRAAGAA